VLILLTLSFYFSRIDVLNDVLGLAWDCGAVTTGPVTVPLVLALGIGVCRVVSSGSGSDSHSGFGIVTLASLFPILAVLILALFHYVQDDYVGAPYYEGATRIEQTAEGPVLSVKTDTAVLRPDVRIEAWQQDSQAQRQVLEGAVNPNGEWTAALGDPGAPVYLEASATTRLGKSVDHRVGPLTAPGVELPAAVTEAPVADPGSAAPGAETPAAEPVAAAQAVAAASPDPGWLVPAILFGGLNLLLLTAGGWWYLRRRAKREGSDSELLLIDAGAAVQGAAETPVREHAA
jgi:hypothetical protein